MNKTAELYNGDAYELIKELQAKNIKIDHIITDPPYNISKKNNFYGMKKARRGINFGEWDCGGFDLYSWIPEYAKILEKKR